MCGDTYKTGVLVRYPYGGVDEYQKPLEPLWPTQIDIDAGIEPYLDAAEAIGDALDALEDELEAGDAFLDNENLEHIHQAMGRADAYLEYAHAVENTWSTYIPVIKDMDTKGHTPEAARRKGERALRWPLGAPRPGWVDACMGRTGDAVKWDLDEDEWIQVICPGDTATFHDRDWDRYREAIEMAAQQARCAQEIFYSLAAYHYNVEIARSPALRAPIRTAPPETAPPPIPPGGAGVPAPVPPSPPPVQVAPKWTPGQIALAALGTAVVIGGGVWAYRRYQARAA